MDLLAKILNLVGTYLQIF